MACTYTERFEIRTCNDYELEIRGRSITIYNQGNTEILYGQQLVIKPGGFIVIRGSDSCDVVLRTSVEFYQVGQTPNTDPDQNPTPSTGGGNSLNVPDTVRNRLVIHFLEQLSL